MCRIGAGNIQDVLLYFSFCSYSRFDIVGYGCTTCIGNSGPLPDEVFEAIEKGELVTCGVLSGNRNFEGRIHPLTRANYLASPPLVVAYALAGTVEIDFETEPIGMYDRICCYGLCRLKLCSLICNPLEKLCQSTL